MPTSVTKKGCIKLVSAVRWTPWGRHLEPRPEAGWELARRRSSGARWDGGKKKVPRKVLEFV